MSLYKEFLKTYLDYTEKIDGYPKLMLPHHHKYLKDLHRKLSTLKHINSQEDLINEWSYILENTVFWKYYKKKSATPYQFAKNYDHIIKSISFLRECRTKK